MRDSLKLAGLTIGPAIVGILLWLTLLFPSITQAARLPLKSYTTADGLAHNTVNKIFRDSRGFLWFCTGEGLSRFDGYSFTNFGTDQGLPHPNVNDILETKTGDFWVATDAGLVFFNPKGVPATRGVKGDSRAPMFTVVKGDDDDRRAKVVSVLLAGRDGTIWCGTLKGLLRLTITNDLRSLTTVPIGLLTRYAEQTDINTLIEDRYGTLWVGAQSGLYRRWPNGDSIRYDDSKGLQFGPTFALLEDRSGSVWVGTAFNGLLRLTIDDARISPQITATYSAKTGLETNWIFALHQSTDGKLWVGSNKGLYEFSSTDGPATGPIHLYTEREGLSFSEVVTLLEDGNGNFWFGTNTVGAMKLTHHGFVSFDARDGVKKVMSIFQSGAGDIYVHGDFLGDTNRSLVGEAGLDFLNPAPIDIRRRLGHLENQHFAWLIPAALRSKYLGWSDRTTAFQARSGEWWIGTGEGLYLFPPVKNFADLKSAQPSSVYQLNDYPFTMVYRLYEDVRGDIWVSVALATGYALARWDHQTRTLHDMAKTQGLLSITENLPTAFKEDSRGNLWVGFLRGEVARYRSDRFSSFTMSNGALIGRINDFYLDKRGRLWIGTSLGGVFRTDDPEAEHPTFTNYSTQLGLSSNYGSAIVEDVYGRIYVGTGRGLDRIDPATGRIEHFTTADGLAAGVILVSFRADNGELWFGTSQGLSRLLPDPPQPAADPPSVLLIGLRSDGVAQQVAANGDSEFFLSDLAPGGNHLQIDFVGLSFAPGESLRYQYRLEGADKDWSAATAQRTVNYANLAPGNYRFFVRALTSDGSFSTVPATVTFAVRPHFWQRWWFLALATMTLALVVYAFYRYRLQRLLQIVNIRSRIAMDLHDDIGANLTRISLLSEVAKQNVGNANGSEDSPLMSISRIARESVGSMSDIVWAIDPKADTLLDLTRKMRQHAEEVFTLRDIDLKFSAPSAKESLRLGVDVRRDLLLIFKEAVNNAARHSRCTQVAIELKLQSSRLLLKIEDNGIGFDDTVETQGHGLRSMKQRVRALAGTLEFVVRPGSGTIISVNIPVTRKLRVI
jgi:signal transduction histidine kinase/ligand-binding sensor domain-containing protein